MAHPLPRKLIVDFANQVETLLIAEELDPFLEEQIRALPDLPPVRVLGKEVFPTMGEFSLELVARCAVEHGLLDGGAVPFPMASAAPDPEGLGIELPAREPVLCPGCGHRSAFYVLGNLSFPDQAGAATETQRAESPYHRANLERRRQHRVVVAGDIGCYTLGALQPLVAMDTCSCMGASIGHALGLEKGGIDRIQTNLATIGTLTFEEPDVERFPALQLARRAGEIGGTLPAVLNAANEVAVSAFCQRRISFPQISETVARVIDQHTVVEQPSLEEILAADAWARVEAGGR